METYELNPKPPNNFAKVLKEAIKEKVSVESTLIKVGKTINLGLKDIITVNNLALSGYRSSRDESVKFGLADFHNDENGIWYIKNLRSDEHTISPSSTVTLYSALNTIQIMQRVLSSQDNEIKQMDSYCNELIVPDEYKNPPIGHSLRRFINEWPDMLDSCTDRIIRITLRCSELGLNNLNENFNLRSEIRDKGDHIVDLSLNGDFLEFVINDQRQYIDVIKMDNELAKISSKIREIKLIEYLQFLITLLDQYSQRAETEKSKLQASNTSLHQENEDLTYKNLKLNIDCAKSDNKRNEMYNLTREMIHSGYTEACLSTQNMIELHDLKLKIEKTQLELFKEESDNVLLQDEIMIEKYNNQELKKVNKALIEKTHRQAKVVEQLTDELYTDDFLTMGDPLGYKTSLVVRSLRNQVFALEHKCKAYKEQNDFLSCGGRVQLKKEGRTAGDFISAYSNKDYENLDLNLKELNNQLVNQNNRLLKMLESEYIERNRLEEVVASMNADMRPRQNVTPKMENLGNKESVFSKYVFQDDLDNRQAKMYDRLKDMFKDSVKPVEQHLTALIMVAYSTKDKMLMQKIDTSFFQNKTMSKEKTGRVISCSSFKHRKLGGLIVFSKTNPFTTIVYESLSNYKNWTPDKMAARVILNLTDEQYNTYNLHISEKPKPFDTNSEEEAMLSIDNWIGKLCESDNPINTMRSFRNIVPEFQGREEFW